MRGLSTLALRMERHSATGAALAAWLEEQPGVTRVWHPGLASHPQHAIAERLLARGGGMLAFELEGGRDAGRAFIDAVRLPERTASLGSVFTIVAHPPSTTHRQLDEQALAAAGISAGLLRCSVGPRGPRRPRRRLRPGAGRGPVARRAARRTGGPPGGRSTARGPSADDRLNPGRAARSPAP